MNCINCGAPLRPEEEKCSYCGTLTPYGERVSKERKQKEIQYAREAVRLREDKARFKYVPVLFVLVFYACTMMFYGPLWYISRANALNNLSDSDGKKLSKKLCVFYAFLCIAVYIFPSEAENYGMASEDTVSNYWLAALIFAAGLSVWMAFRARNILREYAGGFSNNLFGLPFDPFALLLFVIGPLYLQFEVNRMIKRGLLKLKI